MDPSPEDARRYGSAYGPLIVSRIGPSEFVVHPADRKPNRADPRFARLAEADAYIDRLAGAGADPPTAAPTDPSATPAGTRGLDSDVEIISNLPNADGTTVLTGVVSGYTLRATCGAGSVSVHIEDLEVIGLDPASELAQRLIDRWVQHLFDMGYAAGL